MKRKYHPDGTRPSPFQVFVFGSNLSGIHGAGAARAAFHLYGARWGMAEGSMGHSYAIPTVKHHIAGPLPTETINEAVDRFVEYADKHRQLSFFVTRVGCGLAGHEDKDIAPMFKSAPGNCSFPHQWEKYLKE